MLETVRRYKPIVIAVALALAIVLQAGSHTGPPGPPQHAAADTGGFQDNPVDECSRGLRQDCR
jgi:hypothetical protein